MASSVDNFQGLNHLLEDHRHSIARCCQAVEHCLEANRDGLRGFFEQCFSQLLKQIFGYEGSSWLNTIAKGGYEADAKALVGLLSPTGLLFRAINNADVDKLIKFEFPLTRLPTHTQQLIRLEPGRKALEYWPQYNKHIMTDSRGSCHVHLNVFEYFVFWTAFYVLRSHQVSSSDYAQSAPRGYGSLTPSLGTVRKAFGGSREQSHQQKHPYLRLLRLYLEHFLPRTQTSRSYTPSRGWGSPRHRSSSAAAPSNRGAILLNVLIEFWLTDCDEPLPVSLATQGSRELMNAWKETSSLRMRSFQAPSDDLIEALIILTRYIVVHEERDKLLPAQPSTWLPAVPLETMAQGKVTAAVPGRLGPHASPSAQAFGKRLYRFLWRAFHFWPEQQSLTPAIDLWLAYAVPWMQSHAWEPHTASPRHPNLHNLTNTLIRHNEQASTSGRGVSPADLVAWEAHIYANLPFYSTLLPSFMDILRTRVSSRGDAALTDFCKVFHALKVSQHLCDILKLLENDLSRFQSQPGRRPEGEQADLLPFLVQQQDDWQEFAAAGLPANNPQVPANGVSMFGNKKESLSWKARDLLNAAAGAAKETLLHEARSLATSVLPIQELPALHATALPQEPGPTPVHGLRRGSWQDVQYKGDWMRRPLSSFEIGWLVRQLIYISDVLNSSLGLNQPLSEEERRASPGSDIQSILRWMRQRQWRVNLRPIGEIQTLAWTPICFGAFCLIWKFWAFVFASLQSTQSNGLAFVPQA